MSTESRGSSFSSTTIPSTFGGAPRRDRAPVAGATGEQAGEQAGTRSRAVTLTLAAILLLATGIRFWGVLHDLPFSYYGDELHMMKRAMAMGTGDLNPHWFHKPALLMYVLAFFYGLYFAAGLLTGRFESTEEFGAHFLFEHGPFLLIGRLVVLAFGVATVYVVYRLGRKAFGHPAAGLAGALVAAVLAPMISSSQEIKSDVPCGFLMALSVYLYLGTRETGRLRPLVLASLLAGAAMGTHYYGIVLVPTFIAMEALRALSPAVPPVRWRSLLVRGSLVGLLFLGGFFLTSPFNFLDPTWARQTFGGVIGSLGLSSVGDAQDAGESAEGKPVRYEPDTGTAYEPGLAAWAGASAAFFRVITSQPSMGLALTLLSLLGLAATLARRETRWYGLLVLIPCLFFFLAAITVAAYHAQPRHFNAIYPLLATMVWPGLLVLTAPLRSAPRRAWAVAGVLAVLACLPTLAESVRHNREINRLDSRLVSYRWLVSNMRDDTRILVDEYGPLLNPNPQASQRLAERLERLPRGPFTHHQGLRVRLLQQYPPADGVNLDEFGHQWWLPQEKTDAELLNPVDMDMANPLISREPKPLDAYRAQGIRYLVTNSEAQGRYRKRQLQESFPSFARFYRELRGAHLIKTFDPATWGGKGPVVWVYDLAPAANDNEAVPENRQDVSARRAG
ncbi:MAG TPA: glycosyltransferase family 39 protein [Thermoanaerobaculia bacterium]|nr:glycosyltransferase family 39 protein [Thermoanaerobaculia bacterium]